MLSANFERILRAETQQVAPSGNIWDAVVAKDTRLVLKDKLKLPTLEKPIM